MRDWLAAAQAAGEVREIRGADWRLEIGALCELDYRLPHSCALLFDDIVGYPRGLVGLLLLAKWTRAALALALRFVFSVGGPSPCRAGHRRVVCVARAGATSKRAAGRASGSSAAPAVKREAEEDWR